MSVKAIDSMGDAFELNIFEKAVNENFMRELHKNIWTVVENAEQVLYAINNATVWDNSIRKFAAI